MVLSGTPEAFLLAQRSTGTAGSSLSHILQSAGSAVPQGPPQSPDPAVPSDLQQKHCARLRRRNTQQKLPAVTPCSCVGLSGGCTTPKLLFPRRPRPNSFPPGCQVLLKQKLTTVPQKGQHRTFPKAWLLLRLLQPQPLLFHTSLPYSPQLLRITTALSHSLLQATCPELS